MRSGVLLAALLAASSQTPTPTFDVASIKPNRSGTNQSRLDLQPGGRFTAINVSLFMLINFAYGDGGPLPPNRLVFGAKWHADGNRLDTERFDILAKGSDDLTQKDIPGALRALLEDRFRLALHHDTRDRPTYALVLDRADARLGPRLRRSAIDCSNPAAPPPAPDGTSACGFRNRPGSASGRVTIATLVERLLARAVEDQRPIEDRTGLEGTYEFELEWTPVAPPPADAPGGPPIDPNGASLFTALREQLGLKLEPRKGSIDVIVVDRAEYPRQN